MVYMSVCMSIEYDQFRENLFLLLFCFASDKYKPIYDPIITQL